MLRSLAAATLLLVAVTLAAAFDPLRQGLTATYFSDRSWTSSPVLARVERQPSTDSILTAWSGAPPASFSATWSGSFLVLRDGAYTFATRSDDGSWVYVDGRLVVDNGGGHAAKLGQGTLPLEPGVHSIFIKYFQEGGGLQFDLLWARDGGGLETIPDWALSVRQVEFSRTLASVVLRRSGMPVALLWAVVLVAAAFRERERIERTMAQLSARPPLMCTVALGVFVALAVVHTWPLATNPAHLSRNDNGDTLLNTWTIAWVAHQLPRDPRHLFDANIFYPAELTLGYSEAMIVQGVMAMPILAFGGSPVLAYNLVLLAGFTLTGWCFFLLLWRWTRNWSAAFIGGSLAGFNAHVLVQLPHLQFQHVEFIALILLALDRLIVAGRVRDAVWLGVGYALQGMTSVYLMVFTTWMLLFAVLARARACVRDRPFRTTGLLAVAAIVAVAAMLPYLSAYIALHDRTGLERGIDTVRAYSGTWIDYLQTGSRIHYPLWSHRFDIVARADNFPGLTAIVLVVMAIAWPETRRDPRLQMCGVAAVGCVAVSMLPQTPIYPILHRTILLFRAVRAPAHLGQIVLLMIAVVAGYGVAGLARRWRTPQTWPFAALAIFALVNLEALRAPLDYATFTEIPDVYNVLAEARDAVVLELPFPPSQAIFHNAEYMLNSTRHWKPLLNGHSGFAPDWYDELYTSFQGFPDERSIAAMRRRGVTYVVVHGNPIDTTKVDALRPVAASGDISIYRLR